MIGRRLEAREPVSTGAFRLGWGLVLAVLFLQLGSRYLPAPCAVWVADDWANASRSSFYASTAEAAWTGLQDSNRPLSMMAVEVGYRLLGDRVWAWTLVSLTANSLLLLAILKMALELTGRRWIAGAAGALFALLPNLTETYHWSTQVLNEVTCALVPYAWSGWLGVAYFRRGGIWRLALSALFYGIGLFSYEAGILLPGAFLALIAWRREPVKGLLRLAPFGLVCLFYAAWRTTNAFGLNHAWHYAPHMQAGVTPWGLAWNLREIIRWWAGDYLLGAMRSGLRSFAALPPWAFRLLAVGDAFAVLGVGWGLRRLAAADRKADEARPFSGWQVAGFGWIWTVAALAISLASYVAPRLNVLPAIGIVLLAALALERLPFRTWAPILLMPAVLAMASNQGTAESFRQAGRWNREIYAYLRQHADEWRGKKIVLFDTSSLRRSLPPPAGNAPDAWANNGNAPLARGFTFIGMVKLAAGQRDPGIRVLHDIEFGARIEGNQLLWHNRYDPSRPRVDSAEDVFVVDGRAVGGSAK